MSSDDTPETGGGSVLGGLLAPLRLPERLIGSLEALAGDVKALRADLRRVRDQTKPVAGLMPALETLQREVKPMAELLPALEQLEQGLGGRIDHMREVVVDLEGNESHLNKTVQQLVVELKAMHETIGLMKGDIKRLTDRLPDPDEKRGPLQAARDVLTGTSD